VSAIFDPIQNGPVAGQGEKPAKEEKRADKFAAGGGNFGRSTSCPATTSFISFISLFCSFDKFLQAAQRTLKILIWFFRIKLFF